MTITRKVQSLERRVERLAPAGRWDVLQAVLDAGADAVDLSTKQFNMRMHRPDFHFTPAPLADAVSLAHDMDRRIYVMVNAIFGERQVV